MNEEKRQVTQKELMEDMTAQYDLLKANKADPHHIKSFFIVVGRIQKSVSLDMDAAKQLNIQMLERSRKFFADSN